MVVRLIIVVIVATPDVALLISHALAKMAEAAASTVKP